MKAIVRDTASPLCSILKKTIPYGVAYHHSGLITEERKLLEEAFRTGTICVICCTSTLAAGVNLPARRVILRSPYVGMDLITLSRYKQMVGRAGRAGLGEAGESILICPSKDNIRVSSLLCSPMDEAISSLANDNGKGIRSLLLSAIGMNLATNRVQMQELVSKTLMAVQSDRLNLVTRTLIDQTIQTLIQKKAIQVKNAATIAPNLDLSVKILSSQDDLTTADVAASTPARQAVVIRNSTVLEISKLGKAAVRACIDLERSKVLYQDLVEAQKSLVLKDFLHLLYIVTPYETAESLTPNNNIYYGLFVKLSADQLHTARTLGITELCAITMVTGKPVKPHMEKILNRFFVALMLQDLWNLRPVFEVALKFQVDRGIIQNLINQASSNASCILRFCEEHEEFWAFRELLGYFTKRLTNCCTIELASLMELPGVKLGRARQLYNAGFKKLESIARATPQLLVDKIEFLTFRIAKQLIAASKLLLLERIETLREEAQDVLDVLDFNK